MTPRLEINQFTKQQQSAFIPLKGLIYSPLCLSNSGVVSAGSLQTLLEKLEHISAGGFDLPSHHLADKSFLRF